MALDPFVSALMERSYPLPWPGQFVGGEWVQGSGKTATSENPSDGSTLVTFPQSSQTIELAIAAAAAQGPRLATATPGDRLAFLSRIADSLERQSPPLQRALQVELGKPAWEARHDLRSAVQYCREVAALPPEAPLVPGPVHSGEGESIACYPLGVGVSYLPFSSPVAHFVSSAAAAAVAGCPLVFLAPSQCAITGTILAAVLIQSELPPGTFQSVVGGFDAFKAALTDERVRVGIFTGSKEHCDEISRDYRKQLDRTILQSGGKNAVLVHSSADIGAAADIALWGTLRSAGQLCTSTSRALVYRSLLPEFLEAVRERLGRLEIAATDSDDSAAVLGPLYSAKSVERFLRFQTMAQREARETIFWGKELEQPGYFVTPGVHWMKHFDPQSAFQSNVLLAPDLAVYEYDVLDEAIAQINATTAPLAVSFVGDAHILTDRLSRFQAPNVLVNLPTSEVGVALPLAVRTQTTSHWYQGLGMAQYLCRPQAVVDSPPAIETVRRDWPRL